jgi:hypothetical protein
VQEAGAMKSVRTGLEQQEDVRIPASFDRQTRKINFLFNYSKDLMKFVRLGGIPLVKFVV